MKWTTVVATHNRSALLRRALASMETVPGHEMEVVVVDDNSTPEQQAENRRTASEYAHVRYVFLPCAHAEGNGVSVARNVGVKRAHGDVIAFCDDDDHWAPSRFRKFALDAFALDPSLEFAFADVRTDFKGAPVRDHWFPALRSRLRERAGSDYPFFRVTPDDLLVWPGAELPHVDVCLMRRDLFDRCGGFSADIRFGEDFDMVLRALDVARGVAYADEVAAVHERPDRALQESLSSIDVLRKTHTGIYIMHRILQTCSSPAVRRHARNHLGDAYRDLARWSWRDGFADNARHWAAAALAWRFNIRWAAMTTYLASCAALPWVSSRRKA